MRNFESMSGIKHALVLSFAAFSVTACYARVRADGGGGPPPREECRTVVVHSRGEVEQCHTRCHDDRCHTECKEHERVARERRCWVE